MNDWIALSPDECKDGVGNLLVRHRAGVVGVLKEWDAATDRCVVALGDRQTMSAHRLYWTSLDPPARHWNEGELLRLAVETIVEVNRKVDTIMSQVDQLAADSAALANAFGQLTTDLTTGLTDLHAQIVGLQSSPGDVQAIQQIDHQVVGLIAQVQAADGVVKAADPGPQPAPVEPAPETPGPLPDETATPTTPETPESPAAPSVEAPDPASVEGNVNPADSSFTGDSSTPGVLPASDTSVQPIESTPGAGTPDAPADPQV
jgi:hypothetical protein